MGDENWRLTIQAELTSLVKNNTWSLAKLPAHNKAIGYKWVFKVKLRANGSVERYKARLVAKGSLNGMEDTTKMVDPDAPKAPKASSNTEMDL